jgi:pyruvate dehydrogenase E2 component (dihydrolipoamide acetyltransferase)
MGEIFMPKMGDAMTEGKVVRWYKKSGDVVKTGEPLLEIETDKVNLDLEAEEDGVLDAVQAAEGAMIAVGGRLAMILGKGEKAAPPAAPTPAAPEPPEKEEKTETEAPPAAEAEKVPAQAAKSAETPVNQEDRSATGEDNGRKRSSPLARKLAKGLGVTLATVAGSGPSGRIVAADIRKMADAAPVAPAAGPEAARPSTSLPAAQLPRVSDLPALETKDVPLTAMRRTIAKRLVESLGPVPHFFLTIDTDVTQLLALRTQLNEISESKVSVNDFVIRAAALAIRQHPNVNASFGEEAIHQYGEIHIGVAVTTPEGLITPVIRNADGQSVTEIAAAVRQLAERARNRKLRPEDYQGSTLTISNLGMFGIDEFTAIINPPNAAILALGAASPQPTVVGGVVVVRDRMKITMSCDHRVIDGAAGARYLGTLRQYIEQPLRLVI